MKFCIDCKFCFFSQAYAGATEYFFCYKEADIDPVTGEYSGGYCGCQGMRKGSCGKEGKYFEPAEEGKSARDIVLKRGRSFPSAKN
jgi:hypothetical protein